MDELQRKMDADSRCGTFAVDPGHRAFGVRYCEMCGAEVDQGGEHVTSNTDDIDLSIRAIAAMSRWAVYEPKLCLVLSHKVVNPSCTVRDISKAIGVGKSKVDDYLKRVAEIMPALRPILGFDGQRSRKQTHRRKKERNKA